MFIRRTCVLIELYNIHRKGLYLYAYACNRDSNTFSKIKVHLFKDELKMSNADICIVQAAWYMVRRYKKGKIRHGYLAYICGK